MRVVLHDDRAFDLDQGDKPPTECVPRKFLHQPILQVPVLGCRLFLILVFEKEERAREQVKIFIASLMFILFSEGYMKYE